MLQIRSLKRADIARLNQINPTFSAKTVLRVRQTGKPPFQGWTIQEEPLPTPFDKQGGYDFDAIEQQNITERYHNSATTLQQVIENPQTQQLCGILDVSEETWRQTAWIWNLMLDVNIRGQGYGKQLLTITFDWARKRNLRAVMLETQTNNTPACHFYAAMGFQLVGIHQTYYTNTDAENDEMALFWSYALASSQKT